MLGEYEAPAKRQRTLRNQHGFQAFKRARKVRLLQKSCRVLRPSRNTQLPSSRKVLADSPNRRIENQIPGEFRLRIKHGLSSFGMAVKIIQKAGNSEMPIFRVN